MKRAELALGAVLLLAVAATVVPTARAARHRSLRAEVPVVVEALRTAALSHPGAAPLHIGPVPRPPDALTSDRVPLPSSTFPFAVSVPWDSVRGTYTLHMERAAHGVTVRVTGSIDVDGDGVIATYEATSRGAVTRATPVDVF